MKNFVVIAIAILAFCSGMAAAQNPIEKEKIHYLLSSVENLKGAKFIRNGSEHDGKEAAKHLRLKLQNAGEKVQSADDFIRFCASKSSMSGKPYMIRFPDGETIKTEDYFRAKLREFKASVN